MGFPKAVPISLASDLDLIARYEAIRCHPGPQTNEIRRRLEDRLRQGGAIRVGDRIYWWSHGEQSIFRSAAPTVMHRRRHKPRKPAEHKPRLPRICQCVIDIRNPPAPWSFNDD
jgi:hypothetical protein